MDVLAQSCNEHYRTIPTRSQSSRLVRTETSSPPAMTTDSDVMGACQSLVGI